MSILIKIILTLGILFLLWTIKQLNAIWAVSKLSQLALLAYQENEPLSNSQLQAIIEIASKIPAWLWKTFPSIKNHYEKLREIYNV